MTGAAMTSTQPITPDAFRFLHWAILFSPLRDDDLAADAWDALQLPGDFHAIATDFNRCFVIDYPAPKASPIFSAQLQREAGACREEWIRITEHLGMERTGPSLPPDHLALALEILAHAMTRNEKVLVQGILQRYLLPWLDSAQNACEEENTLRYLLQQLRLDAVSLDMMQAA